MSFAKKLLLTAVVAAPILVGANSPTQSPTGKRLAYEVASVKRNNSGDFGLGKIHSEPDGRLTVRGAPLYLVITAAYHLPLDSPRLSGGPDWIRSERYDIDARPAKGASSSHLSLEQKHALSMSMLQTLLADRFQLTIRRETKELPVYALTVANNGPKLRKSTTDEQACAASNAPGTKRVPCHRFQGGQGRGLHGTAVNMTDLVAYAENWTDRPLIDKTGVQVLFDIETEGWASMRPRRFLPPQMTPGAEDPVYINPAPTLFTIFERLGLKMEPQSTPVETYVIERIERPAGKS